MQEFPFEKFINTKSNLINMKQTLKEIFEEALENISKLGSNEISLIVLATIFILIGIKEGITITIGFFILTLVAIIIRLCFFKNRPNSKKFNNMIEKVKASSTPSMHSARISYFGFFVSNVFGNLMFSILIGVVIFLVAFSRYYEKKHYLIDIILGLLFGTIMYGFTLLFL